MGFNKKFLDTAYNLIKGCTSPFLFTHAKPDGDAIGAIFSFKMAMNRLKKNVVAFCSSPLPPLFQFLSHDLQKDLIKDTPDLLVVLDTAKLELLGEIYEKNVKLFQKTPILNIDHHPDNTMFGRVNLVNSKASCTGEILFDLFKTWDITITKNIADALLTSIIVETLSFQLPHTTHHTMEAAAHLMRRGGDLNWLLQQLQKTNNKDVYNLWGEVLLKTKTTDNDLVAWSYISIDMLARHGVKISDIYSDGLINVMSSLRKSSVVVLFKEEESNKIRVSFRSTDNYNVQKIATFFGGGGHINSAACTIEKSLRKTINKVIHHINNNLL
ncbi:MAG: DHHA1 domain-containing protein [Thermodesulfobacteriota bacterium]|nr:DHHA1 domain-containing protein [Thermodesulfobacteriota bacterium]